MAAEIRVPEMGESITEATVSRWMKQQGDSVGAGEAVVELETEKANVEVSAPQPGILARIDRKQGEDVRVGDVLGAVEAAPSGGAAPAQKAPPAPAKAAAEPEKRSEQKPELRTQARRAEPARAAEPAQRPQPVEPKQRTTGLAARMARQEGVDLASIAASGPGGRVTKEDIEKHLASGQQSAREEQPAAAPTRPMPEMPTAVEGARPEERQHMSRRRQTIARRMLEASQTTAMLTSFNEVDMTAVMEIRKRQKEAFERRHGVRLGIMSFFVQAVISALREFPVLNAEVQGDDIVLKHYYDIGVAIGAAEGLVVPVLRDTDAMSFAEIERVIQTFSQKAEQKTLSLEDLRGGTFTITNGGVFGSLMSTPILNPPQSGILGLHKIADRPIVRDGQIAIRPMMYTALTYDHRIVDGREAVQFLVRVKERIETPEQLLLGM